LGGPNVVHNRATALITILYIVHYKRYTVLYTVRKRAGPFFWAALMLGANGPSAQIRAAQISANIR
jgi:hypothetical protein